MPQYENLTDPTSRALAPKGRQIQSGDTRKPTTPLPESDLRYLEALIDAHGNRLAAMEATGHELKSPEDVGSVLRAVGMGIGKWALRLAWLYDTDEAKYVAVP